MGINVEEWKPNTATPRDTIYKVNHTNRHRKGIVGVKMEMGDGRGHRGLQGHECRRRFSFWLSWPFVCPLSTQFLLASSLKWWQSMCQINKPALWYFWPWFRVCDPGNEACESSVGIYSWPCNFCPEDLHNKHLDVPESGGGPLHTYIYSYRWLAAHKWSHLYGRYVCLVCGQLPIWPPLLVCRTWPGRARPPTQANNPTCTLPMTVVNMTVIRTLIQMLRMFVLARQEMLFVAGREWSAKID